MLDKNSPPSWAGWTNIPNRLSVSYIPKAGMG